MIELIWREYLARDCDTMMCITSLLAWMSTTIAQEEEYHSIKVNGYMCVKDQDQVISTIIICDNNESQNKLLKLLQQPPAEYKEKYTACIPSSEPIPVQEQKNDEDDDEEQT